MPALLNLGNPQNSLSVINFINFLGANNFFLGVPDWDERQLDAMSLNPL